MKVIDLKCNYQKNPIGISLDKVVFSWKCIGAKGEYSDKTEIIIAEDEKFRNVLHKEGAASLFSGAYSPHIEWIPGKTYYWRIRITDNTGDYVESDVQSFEGGHPEGQFRGDWITPSFSREIHPVMRKSFTLTAEDVSAIKRARLYICGLGLYEVYINGARVGNEYLTPYCTDYRYWTEYQTYAVERYLKPGENVIDVLLGNGWYKGRFGYLAHGQMREYFGDKFLLIADLMMRGDGIDRTICTDETWVCLKSPVAMSGIYDGEIWDSRKVRTLAAPSQRDVSKVILSDAPQGKLTPMIGVPVKAHERIKPVKLINTPAGELVLDFGQEVTGWAEFTSDAPEEKEIVLEYGEVLQKGNFYRENLRTADAKYTFIGSGKKTRARAHFTFYGFRYVKVSGMTAEEIESAEFEAVSIYSDIAETGSIETSNEKINRLIANTKWSQKDNFVDIPTDCPQRDERCGWTGDAQIFSSAASYHMETAAFFRKYLTDMRYEQKEKDGAVPYVVPDILTIGRQKLSEPEFDYTVDMWGEAGASVWGDAAVIIPWNMYLHYGNKHWLEEQYENMKSWTDFIIRMEEDHCGGKRLWDCGFHFGDWLSLDVEGDPAGMDNREGGTDKYFVSSIYYMVSSEITSKAAEVLDYIKDREFYHTRSVEVRNAVRDKYVTGPGTLSINTQTAYAIAIWFNLFEEDEMEEAGNNLLKVLEAWNYHLATGFVGTAFLCGALTKTGHVKDAYTLLLNEDYPSWLYEVNLGATTVWERWNSLLPDGSISGTGMNSLNHYAYGAIVEWIYTAVCGIGVDEKNIAGKSMVISPHTDERLGFAKASVDLPVGMYRSGWKLENNTVSYEFQIPFGGKARFVPDRELKDITLNGNSISEDELREMQFHRGVYKIVANI